MPPIRRPKPILPGPPAALVLGLLVLAVAACAPGSPAPTPAESESATPARSPTPSPSPSPSIAPTPGGTVALELELVNDQLLGPVGIVDAGDGSGRLFVVEQIGRVQVLTADGSLAAEPFLDISDHVLAGGEQGLLGLAFHPQFAANGRLFVYYTRTLDGAEVLSEVSAVGGQAADAASERQLLVIPDPYINHNGGQLAFGPDGYLYVGEGDGGAGGDPHGNGQSLETLLGKILRLDVDSARGDPPYAIPADNPYAAGGIDPGAGLPEIWAFGLRNPWRFSFDRETGDLYIGDVGQGSWEEIDHQPAASSGGDNFGWVVMEGTHCVRLTCDSAGLVLPVAEYGHDEGCSVTGGYVYRGTRFPALVGTYLFADYCSGYVWGMYVDTLPMRAERLLDTDMRISSFGEAADGQLYLADHTEGAVYRILAR